MRNRPLPSRRDIGVEEMKELVEVISSGNLCRVGGMKVKEFEQEFAALYGVRHAVASTSGTAAIHVALGAINPEPGSEIITGPISDMGTVIPILRQNCIPVFADIDSETYCLDPRDVARKITDRTAAVISVHLFGQAGEMDELSGVCKRKGLHLIEDASQAHLSVFKGKLVGTIGEMGCFSLQQSKQMTTGDGGITITDDQKLAERARLFADKAWPREDVTHERDYLFLGMNYRMTELQGAVGIAQLRKVASIVERRRRSAEKLTSILRGVDGICPPFVPQDSKHSYWLYPFTIDRRKIGVSPSKFAEAVSAEGVPCDQGYTKKPLYLFPVLKDMVTYGSSHCPFGCPLHGRAVMYREGDCPNAERVIREILTVPMNEFYSEPDTQDIAAALAKVAVHYSSK